ncbi:hypothetical protein [Tsukamurella tyrosinosolvens]|uniref:hypothetical protein n=1 Tax=Tsukamurella tyrosinosolvens TaxID=57704 RepID=UPI00125FE0D9|nr:hypothetical protein [Tsukamurella tyrosinosolvens]
MRIVSAAIFAAVALGTVAIPATASASPTEGWYCRGYASNGAYATAHIHNWEAASNAAAASLFHQKTGASKVTCRSA